ncbi:hypothetical protein E3T29_01790 [Cryobacterium sp. TMT1-66-1]|nr:hypothetical protein E3T29_01790 [Cryobacterium sp. TMT1-66-1]
MSQDGSCARSRETQRPRSSEIHCPRCHAITHQVPGLALPTSPTRHLKALRTGETLLVWKLDRLGRVNATWSTRVHDLIAERTVTGLAAARARGRTGGRPFKMTPAKVRLAMAAMGQKETQVGDLCKELGITRQTLYRHVSPAGELRSDGAKLFSRS